MPGDKCNDTSTRNHNDPSSKQLFHGPCESQKANNLSLKIIPHHHSSTKMSTPTTALLSLSLELRHSILLNTHTLDTTCLNHLLDQRIKAQNNRKQVAMANNQCCEISNKAQFMEQRAAETLRIELIQQERLAKRARKRVMLVCRQMAQDMEYVTEI